MTFIDWISRESTLWKKEVIISILHFVSKIVHFMLKNIKFQIECHNSLKFEGTMNYAKKATLQQKTMLNLWFCSRWHCRWRSRIASCTCCGNIEAKATLTIVDESILTGNIKAKNLVFNARQKGNIFVENPNTFMSKSRLFGNVATKSVSIIDGQRSAEIWKSVYTKSMRMNSLI